MFYLDLAEACVASEESEEMDKTCISPSFHHPTEPKSNVPKFSGFDPNDYLLDNVSLTVKTNEALIPGRPPCLTQATVGKFLQPCTRELAEVPPRPTIAELPDAVIDRMVQRDKAFWVDKPGANAYTLHDAYYSYGMTTKQVLPTHQAVFPRSYQYDVDCVSYRRRRACDEMKSGVAKELPAHCRDCRKLHESALTPFQLTWAQDPGQKRWRYYPDLTANLTRQEIRASMDEVGRPFMHEACTWYNQNYPSAKYDLILRKFAK